MKFTQNRKVPFPVFLQQIFNKSHTQEKFALTLLSNVRPMSHIPIDLSRVYTDLIDYESRSVDICAVSTLTLNILRCEYINFEIFTRYK